MCQFQYLLQYVLGLKSKPNYKTEIGSIVHKALELLAHRKVCEQENISGFYEDELKTEFWAEDVNVENAVEHAWRHYTFKNESGHKWSSTEYKKCLDWTTDVIEMNNGMFSPLNRKIICPEQYFDIVIEEPWAWYEYTDPKTGEKISGYLALKGSIDLITEINSNTIEYLDWKSGKPYWDWANDKEKTFLDLCNDPQLLMYFYALNKLYPQYRTKVVTIFYAQAKSPTTISFGQEDITKVLEMLKKRFIEIKNNLKPKRIMDDAEKKWKCFSFCYYGKTKTESGQSLCNFYNRELQQLGMDKVIKKHGDGKAYKLYGSGGGADNRETEVKK